MAKYSVAIPLAGCLTIEVEAEDEEAAKAAAWTAFGERGEGAGDLEWDCLDRIVEGNVFHGSTNTVQVDPNGE